MEYKKYISISHTIEFLSHDSGIHSRHIGWVTAKVAIHTLHSLRSLTDSRVPGRARMHFTSRIRTTEFPFKTGRKRIGPIVISARRVKGRCSARRTGWLLSRSHMHLPGDLVRLRIEKQHVARRTKTPGKSDEYSWDAGIILCVTQTRCLIGHDELERDPRQSCNTRRTMSSNNRYGATDGFAGKSINRGKPWDVTLC